MNKPEIQILSQAGAVRVLEACPPGHYRVVSLRDSWLMGQHPVDPFLTDDDLVLTVDDVTGEYGDVVAPDMDLIHTLMEWANALPRDDPELRLLVHCAMGVSRSSAAAYIIASCLMPPQEALEYLDPLRHHPNRRMLELANRVEELPDLLSAYFVWMYS